MPVYFMYETTFMVIIAFLKAPSVEPMYTFVPLIIIIIIGYIVKIVKDLCASLSRCTEAIIQAKGSYMKY